MIKNKSNVNLKKKATPGFDHLDLSFDFHCTG